VEGLAADGRSVASEGGEAYPRGLRRGRLGHGGLLRRGRRLEAAAGGRRGEGGRDRKAEAGLRRGAACPALRRGGVVLRVHGSRILPPPAAAAPAAGAPCGSGDSRGRAARALALLEQGGGDGGGAQDLLRGGVREQVGVPLEVVDVQPARTEVRIVHEAAVERGGGVHADDAELL